MIRNVSIAVVLVTAVFLCACSGGNQNSQNTVTYITNASELSEINARDWPTYGGQASGTQYSALDQINLDNVNELEVAWTYHAGDLSWGSEEVDTTDYQVTPIYNNEKLYLCTPFNHIVALDPENGEELWRFDPGRPLTGMFYAGNYCRGVAYWQAETVQEQGQPCGKRVFELVQNGTLVAVDGDTGKLCPGFGKESRVELNDLDYHGEGKIYNTSPPAVYGDVVITGSSIYDNKYSNSPDGIVRAFDARTGEERWHWNPIPAHLSEKTGGANTWAPISIDRERGWVFLPTTSPSLDQLGINRRESIPDANAVVVLDALTGERIWSYQTVHHDLWDYDLPAMPTLVNLQREGRRVPAVLQPTKMGYIFVLERNTGKPLFPVVETPVPGSTIPGEYTSPTQPIPTLPAPVASTSVTADDAWGLVYFDRRSCHNAIAGLRNEGIYTPPDEQGSILFPSFIGGINWGGIAYDEATGLAVVNSSDMVTSQKLLPREAYDEKKYPGTGIQNFEMKDAPYALERAMLESPIGIGPKHPPCNPPPWGRLTAIDMNTGETRWQIPFGRINLLGPIKSPVRWGSPNQGGPIITRGGLVFIGASPDSLLRAYNLRTGELVWTGDIPAPAIATPMTYEHGPDRRQFVVIAAGGHDGFFTEKSDAIVAFALPD